MQRQFRLVSLVVVGTLFVGGLSGGVVATAEQSAGVGDSQPRIDLPGSPCAQSTPHCLPPPPLPPVDCDGLSCDATSPFVAECDGNSCTVGVRDCTGVDCGAPAPRSPMAE